MGTKIRRTEINFNSLKPVGVIRGIDKAGRLTLSSEARDIMELNEDDLVEQTLYREKGGEYVLVVRKFDKR